MQVTDIRFKTPTKCAKPEIGECFMYKNLSSIYMRVQDSVGMASFCEDSTDTGIFYGVRLNDGCPYAGFIIKATTVDLERGTIIVLDTELVIKESK